MQKIAETIREGSDSADPCPPLCFGVQMSDEVLAQFRRVRHSDGRLRLVKGLTPFWVNWIRNFLCQIDNTNGQAFDRSIALLLAKGYRLTSLVTELRYEPTGDIRESLHCDVRPKIGAKPAFDAEARQR
jgi:hypothetical protein